MERGKRMKNKGIFANLGFEDTLSGAAGKLHANLELAVCKHAVLWLTFLIHSADSIEEHRHKLMVAKSRKVSLGEKSLAGLTSPLLFRVRPG